LQTGERVGNASVAKKENPLKKKTKKKFSTQKKNNKRNLTKYPALDPKVNLKSRTELLDYDYLNKLDEKELEWLNKFTEEYVHANLNTKEPKKNLHRTKKMRIDCYNRNNSRNRDVLTKGKISNKLDNVDTILDVGYDEEKKIHTIIDANIELTRNKKVRRKMKLI
jgi:hypothetical protein